jgi:hypothetical protein
MSFYSLLQDAVKNNTPPAVAYNKIFVLCSAFARAVEKAIKKPVGGDELIDCLEQYYVQLTDLEKQSLDMGKLLDALKKLGVSVAGSGNKLDYTYTTILGIVDFLKKRYQNSVTVIEIKACGAFGDDITWVQCPTVVNGDNSESELKTHYSFDNGTLDKEIAAEQFKIEKEEEKINDRNQGLIQSMIGLTRNFVLNGILTRLGQGEERQAMEAKMNLFIGKLPELVNQQLGVSAISPTIEQKFFRSLQSEINSYFLADTAKLQICSLFYKLYMLLKALVLRIFTGKWLESTETNPYTKALADSQQVASSLGNELTTKFSQNPQITVSI